MLRFNFCRLLMVMATCSLGLTASTAIAKGGKRGGQHVGHRHHGGHHIGYAGNRGQIGRYYGGYGYGGQIGHRRYGRGFGVGIAIGGGYHHRYRGFVSPYAGYGYGYSVYSPYRTYTPYYPGSTALRLGYRGTSYDYLYGRAPATGYVYPEPRRYRAAKPAVSSSDLRPGMILPDGSRVISVGPAESEGDATEPQSPAADAPVPAPAIPEPNEPGTNDGEIEELPTVAPDNDTVKA